MAHFFRLLRFMNIYHIQRDICLFERAKMLKIYSQNLNIFRIFQYSVFIHKYRIHSK